jgi:hypothetical protein
MSLLTFKIHSFGLLNSSMKDTVSFPLRCVLFDHAVFEHSGVPLLASLSRHLSFLILDRRLVNEVCFFVSCMLKRGYSSEDI